MESEPSLSDLSSLNSDVLDPAIRSNNSQNTPSIRTSTSTSSLLPPTLQINGISYEVVERMKNKRAKTSWIWNEGYQLTKPPSGSDPKKESEISSLCRRCYKDGKHVKYGASSTNHVASAWTIGIDEVTSSRAGGWWVWGLSWFGYVIWMGLTNLICFSILALRSTTPLLVVSL